MKNYALVEFQVQARILLPHLHNARECAFVLLHEKKRKNETLEF